jgi:putative hydrolase of the HAD superfamily
LVSSPRPQIAAVLLDVDDTLIDTRVAMVAAGQAAVAELWPLAGPEVHHAAAVRFHADPRGFFVRFTAGELSFPEMREARVADLLDFFSLPATGEVMLRFEEVYGPAFAAEVRLFDDVLPFIEAARIVGTPIGLLTNSSSLYTSQKLELTGLASVFDVVATRDTLGFGKPDARAFRHACALLGAAPAETLYVGDHLEIDAIAARDAGLRAVWLQRDQGGTHDGLNDALHGALSRARADAHGIQVVSSLCQVPALLTDG